MTLDKRVVYSVSGTWWGDIADAGHVVTPGGHRLPCCPHCKSVLMEMDSEKTWFKGVDVHEARGNPGYRKIVEWGKGRCFPNYQALEAAYKEDVS